MSDCNHKIPIPLPFRVNLSVMGQELTLLAASQQFGRWCTDVIEGAILPVRSQEEKEVH